MTTKLIKISHWLMVNDFYRNIDKTVFFLFPDLREKENVPLKLPLISNGTLEINR